MATLTDTPQLSPDVAVVPDSYQMGLDDNGRLMTVEEFIAHDDWDDNYRYELVHGVLIVNPPPDLGQRGPNEELGHWLWDFGRQHPGVIDLTISEQYVILPESRRIADRVIWAGLGRVPQPDRDVPTIAIEFVSRSRRDRIRDYHTKRDEYLAAGVREYWVIDRFQRSMAVFQMGPNGPAGSLVREQDVYRTPLLPGFELPLAKLFAIAHLWDKPPLPSAPQTSP